MIARDIPAHMYHRKYTPQCYNALRDVTIPVYVGPDKVDSIEYEAAKLNRLIDDTSAAAIQR